VTRDANRGDKVEFLARILAACAVALGISQLAAEPRVWTKNEAELLALSELGAGYAWAEICNKKVDTEAAARFMEAKLGAGRRFTPRQAADLMLLVVDSIGLGQLVMAEGCADLRENYGAGGKIVPGLLY
jgi:hypothetical protein